MYVWSEPFNELDASSPHTPVMIESAENVSRADSIADLFYTFSKTYSLTKDAEPLRTDLFTPPHDGSGQLSLFS